MTMTASERSTANTEYLRKLLRQRQPGFAAALERAADLLEEELGRVRAPRGNRGPVQLRRRRHAAAPACGPAHR